MPAGPSPVDCWLLSPLAAIATHSPDTIRRVFARCTPAEVKRGHIRVLLYRHGEWEEVAVDSLLPCDESGRPLFCGRFGGQSWAANWSAYDLPDPYCSSLKRPSSW